MRTERNERLILARLSAELTTKARGTRKRFTRRLVENIRTALKQTDRPFHVESRWTRVHVVSDAPEAPEILTRVAGLSSISAVEARVPAALDDIVAAGREVYGERVKGRRYAVRAKRTGTHPFSSYDVQQRLGAALNPGATVDLTNPDVEVQVEVRDEWAYLFSEKVPGLGGLPLGVEGRASCLLSGGFDSAVAAWLFLKRGVQVDYVFCNLAAGAYERSVAQVAHVLADRWSYGTRPKLHVIDFTEVLDDLRGSAEPKYWQLVLKRLMYRAAASVAAETGGLGIVTGEAIGQVSSQTLSNLAAIEAAVELPVFRPLIGFDKAEIVDLSRRVGTYDLSARVKEYCAIAPGSPVTSSTPAAAAAEEAKLNPEVLQRAIAERRVLEPGSLTAADLVDSYLFVEAVPEGAVVIDVRPEEQWAEWHFPGSLRWDPWETEAAGGRLDADRRYVVFCDAGIQAAILAEGLQKSGIEAYAFRGGMPALRAQAREVTGA